MNGILTIFRSFKKLKMNKDRDFTLEFSNVLYLLDNLKHDKGNIELRLELANNLENLNNISEALFHLFIAHELKQKDQSIIKKIVINLIRIKDLHEAKKWSLKLNIDNIYSLTEYSELFNKENEINKLIYFGDNFKNYPFIFNIDSSKDIENLNSEDKDKIKSSQIAYVTKNHSSNFQKFYKLFKEDIKYLSYIFSEAEDIEKIINTGFNKINYSKDKINEIISSFSRGLTNSNLNFYYKEIKKND